MFYKKSIKAGINKAPLCGASGLWSVLEGFALIDKWFYLIGQIERYKEEKYICTILSICRKQSTIHARRASETPNPTLHPVKTCRFPQNRVTPPQSPYPENNLQSTPEGRPNLHSSLSTLHSKKNNLLLQLDCPAYLRGNIVNQHENSHLLRLAVPDGGVGAFVIQRQQLLPGAVRFLGV